MGCIKIDPHHKLHQIQEVLMWCHVCSLHTIALNMAITIKLHHFNCDYLPNSRLVIVTKTVMNGVQLREAEHLRTAVFVSQ